VLQFLRTSFTCPNYTTLIRELLNANAAYGLEGCVQLCGKTSVVSMNNERPCSPQEESVLMHMALQGRLFEFGSRTSCSHPHVTVIIKNMPRDDEERHGRMKDNLALLTEGANARVQALDDQFTMSIQQQFMLQLISGARDALAEIEGPRKKQMSESSQIMEDFHKQLERMLLSLGLTQSQEDDLLQITQPATQRMMALYEQGHVVEQRMQALLQKPEQPLQG